MSKSESVLNLILKRFFCLLLWFCFVGLSVMFTNIGIVRSWRGGRVEFRWKSSVNTASCCLAAVLAWCLISLSDVGDSNVSSHTDPHVNYYDWCRHSRSRSQQTIGASETQLLEPASLSSLSFSRMWLQASHPSLSTHNKVTSCHFLITDIEEYPISRSPPSQE